MNCEGEGAPTRQNIKSHLQKYRLLMQKRARQQATQSSGGGGGDGGSSSGMGGDAGGSSSQSTDVQGELEQHLARQEMNLKVQMELQTKLHRQLLVQRQVCTPPGSPLHPTTPSDRCRLSFTILSTVFFRSADDSDLASPCVICGSSAASPSSTRSFVIACSSTDSLVDESERAAAPSSI